MANQRILISLASRRMDKDATCPLVIITRPGFNRLREEFAQQRSDRGGGLPACYSYLQFISERRRSPPTNAMVLTGRCFNACDWTDLKL